MILQLMRRKIDDLANKKKKLKLHIQRFIFHFGNRLSILHMYSTLVPHPNPPQQHISLLLFQSRALYQHEISFVTHPDRTSNNVPCSPK